MTSSASTRASNPASGSLGFDGTRPVQAGVIPLALDGDDVIACAETGTEKTLAFAAPILELLLTEQPGYGDPAREAFTRALWEGEGRRRGTPPRRIMAIPLPPDLR
ncbi:MAG: DEAD/DEAH box helicase [Vicinamibacterales bacterium]